MSEETCILVCGIDETASAIARHLFVDGHTVVIHQSRPPGTLARKMAFADAWFDGAASLDGIEARRVDLNTEFDLSLGTRAFIPVLTHPFIDVSSRWPWDVVVASRVGEEPIAGRLRAIAGFLIGLGAGFGAGIDRDIVIETEGPDHGAIIRAGMAPARRPRPEAAALGRHEMRAPVAGLFLPTKGIGAVVERDEPIDVIGEALVLAPVGGRLRGLARKGRAVVVGTIVADIATSRAASVSGLSQRDRLIARGVGFAVEMELEGWAPVDVDAWR
jgi:xanthine dehydrogenase accessory factor